MDIIYTDKSYNNMTYEQLILNFKIKLYDLEDYSDKILKVIYKRNL